MSWASGGMIRSKNSVNIPKGLKIMDWAFDMLRERLGTWLAGTPKALDVKGVLSFDVYEQPPP